MGKTFTLVSHYDPPRQCSVEHLDPSIPFTGWVYRVMEPEYIYLVDYYTYYRPNMGIKCGEVYAQHVWHEYSDPMSGDLDNPTECTMFILPQYPWMVEWL